MDFAANAAKWQNTTWWNGDGDGEGRQTDSEQGTVEDDQCNAKINDQSCYVDQCCDERREEVAGSIPSPLRMKGSIEPVIVPQRTIPSSEQETVRPTSIQCSP